MKFEEEGRRHRVVYGLAVAVDRLKFKGNRRLRGVKDADHQCAEAAQRRSSGKQQRGIHMLAAAGATWSNRLSPEPSVSVSNRLLGG